ncbi:MAG: DNA mismatch repair protein msh6 [Sclerophora amabilis]|nr:MAG: DNA mismatch repair protein msh6 [Sclerophora amabilis]
MPMAMADIHQTEPPLEVPPPALKKSTSGSQSAGNQKSILGFFQKQSSSPSNAIAGGSSKRRESSVAKARVSKASASSKRATVKGSSSQSLTPAPSSDALEPSSSQDDVGTSNGREASVKALPSPVTPGLGELAKDSEVDKLNSAFGAFSSPSRKARKNVSYAESDDEDDDEEDVYKPVRSSRARDRSSKRRKTTLDEESEDDFQDADGNDDVDSDDDIDSFVVADESEEEPKPSQKRKRPSATRSRQVSSPLPPPPADDKSDLEIPTVSTAQQWTYDPENTGPLQPRSDADLNATTRKPKSGEKKTKEKAHSTEPEQRYPWLAKITDADRNPPGHPDYDPRTVYIPPLAWSKFSPFEKQYWEIKQKFWDTIVFFKKGKFYELYENDATIGHQLFDLKLTDRVNMRMVGVPEMSLGLWANQFVAKGYKIARVDQSESALGKEMREREDNGGTGPIKQEKIIRRELAQVLTAGTLVDGGMLQDDMSTYCASIKASDETTLNEPETVEEGLPAFGISFVDTATGQFSITEFVDDVDMTKFETFVAQTRPQELLLEKSCISVKALRILKNNTGPTTIWNYLKPGKEYWTADVTRREIDASRYFVSEDQDDVQAWPEVLRKAREKELLMSSFGALLQYLRMLKIERDLVTIKNFIWYDPIRKATSLVLDGQTLINLEVFANSFEGSSSGTLFALLNRCVTPFGKRMFRQWVCHPLADPAKINARLDAVDSLNADTTVRNRFTSQMTKIPDLERLISRIHAGSCKAQDFARVLEGFEQIDYTMSLLASFGSGDGVIGKLITAMPDLNEHLAHWKTAFDRTKAKEDGILVPEVGVEEDFDESQARIERILSDLEKLLKKYRRDLGSTSIVYRDNGKEIFQLEVPTKVKNVPRNWDQMSATQKVKRYYSPELRGLVRQLQEAQETHGQIVKEVAGRFLARFDQEYGIWLAAVKIIAQLDCLISLANATSALGETSCRPEFVEDERSVVQFDELRHPCMLPTVADFIPNDVNLGGDAANITLLTGANAAGKSTILRMTCVAVIMAQIGCYVPCKSARLTPVDRIMSRLGANDNIFAAQSTFFVELSETKKILSEATHRSLVILDELGRGTSSFDGVAVAQAVLHHVATHVGCTGFFATHYHSLAPEFAGHPEISPKRMQIHVDDANRRITFLFKLEDGVAEGSFGMHCAAMCGIPNKVIERAEVAAREWEHTSKLKESLEKARSGCYVPLGIQSDFAWAVKEAVVGQVASEEIDARALAVLMKAVEAL